LHTHALIRVNHGAASRGLPGRVDASAVACLRNKDIPDRMFWKHGRVTPHHPTARHSGASDDAKGSQG